MILYVLAFVYYDHVLASPIFFLYCILVEVYFQHGFQLIWTIHCHYHQSQIFSVLGAKTGLISSVIGAKKNLISKIPIPDINPTKLISGVVGAKAGLIGAKTGLISGVVGAKKNVISKIPIPDINPKALIAKKAGMLIVQIF